MGSLENTLAEHPFFRDLDVSHLSLIAEMAREVTFSRDEYLFREGQDADIFYLLLKGIVAIEIRTVNRGQLVIQTLGEGELVGWSWTVPPYVKNFDARAVEPVRAISIDGEKLRTVCEQNCDLGYQLMKRTLSVVSQRLQATRMQLLDLYNDADTPSRRPS